MGRFDWIFIATTKKASMPMGNIIVGLSFIVLMAYWTSQNRFLRFFVEIMLNILLIGYSKG